MKNLLLSISLLFSLTSLMAQQKNGLIYFVKGSVVDSTGHTVIGASVKLRTANDSVSTSTNLEGTYTFSNIKSPDFSLYISCLGYSSFSRTYSFKTDNPQISIPIIRLKIQLNMLGQVVVDGTPTIVYKTDTTQFKASDYKVKENANVEDLVKKMEGMEVDNDGVLTVQGEAVVRARINGKDYFGGDVANAIKNLPADIVDKIQIVNDYGDEAAKTGVKDGEPEKVLNIVTRQDKKVGNRGKFETGLGSSDRYVVNLNGNRFDGNQQIGVKIGLNNTVTGLAQDNNSGGSGGTKQSGQINIYYNDDLSEKVKINTNYEYNGSTANSLNDISIEEYNTIGTIYSNRNGNSNNQSRGHSLRGKLEYNPNQTTWLIFRPNINLRTYDTNSENILQQTGALYQDQNSYNLNNGTSPSYDFRLNTGHRFNDKGTFLSIDLNYSYNKNNQFRDARNNILYYDTAANHDLILDSLVHRQIDMNNFSKSYRTSVTYGQSINEKARFELNGQINYRGYENKQVTGNLDSSGNFGRIDSLSRIFNYSFTETRLALNYRFKNKKINYSIGVTAVPGLLTGQSQNGNSTIKRASFNIIPILRFDYEWSKQKKLSFRYYGRPQEPSYQQIQDVRDVTNPQNPIIGNPNLKASFRHYMRADFNNYIINSKITLHGRVSATINQNQVIRNKVLIRDEYNSLKRETYFLNANGNYNYSLDYNFSKRFANKYAISFNGNYDFDHSLSQTNSINNTSKSFVFRHKLGFQITPNDWLEINPNIRYSTLRTNFSLPTSKENKNNNLDIRLDGKTYFIKSLYLSYRISKNFVNGINPNVTSNPLIINTSITKEFFEKSNASISFRAYDLLSQNNFVTRRVTENSIIDTRTNALSRYFMLTLSWSPQKWTSGSGNNSRNGDGSYRK